MLENVDNLSLNLTHYPLEYTATILSLTVSSINSAFRFLSGRLNLFPLLLVAEAVKSAVKPSWDDPLSRVTSVGLRPGVGVSIQWLDQAEGLLQPHNGVVHNRPRYPDRSRSSLPPSQRPETRKSIPAE